MNNESELRRCSDGALSPCLDRAFAPTERGGYKALA